MSGYQSQINYLIDYWFKKYDDKKIQNTTKDPNFDLENILIKHTLQNDHCGPKLLHIIIDNKKLAITNRDSNHITVNKGVIPRINIFENYFSSFVNANKLENKEFILDMCDGTSWRPIFNDIYLPILSQSVPNTPTIPAIPIPDAHSIIPKYCPAAYDLNYVINQTPLRNRKNKICWRGGPVPTFINQIDDQCNTRSHIRLEVCKKWFDNPCFDIGITCNEEFHTWLKPYEKYKTDFLTIKEMSNFKYILAIDGHASSYDATIWKLRSGSLIIRVSHENIEWHQWYTPLLIPYVHYIPTTIDKIIDVFEWCESHPVECQQIVENADKLMKIILLISNDYTTAVLKHL